MDLVALSNYYTDSTLTSNYYPLYVRKSGETIISLLQPSFDILKYKFTDETTIYTDSNVNYLDKVSYEEYGDYTQTRNLYITNPLIRDPLKTYEFTTFVLVDRNKAIDTISKGILFNNRRVNYTFESFNLSYIYDSLLNKNSLYKKVKSIDDIVYKIMQYYSNTDAYESRQYCYLYILNQYM